jgi:hypothetical protein
MRRLFLSTVLAAASAGSLAAQGALSVQGFGYPVGQLSTRAAGTAGALGEMDAGSPLNPAALFSAGRTILSFQFDPEFRQVKVGGATVNTTTARFPLIMVGAKVGARGFVGASFSTLLDRTWDASYPDSVTVSGDRVLSSVGASVRGGINDAQLAFGWLFSEKFQAGLGFHAITGANHMHLARVFTDSTTFGSLSQTTVLSYSGAAVSAGIVALPAPHLTFAASLRLGGAMNTRYDDSLATHAKVPNRYGASLTYNGIPGSQIAVRFDHEQWSRLQSLGSPSLQVNDATELSAGVDFVGPKFQGLPTQLRLGARTRDLPFGWNGHTVSERSFAFGGGLPLARGWATVDVSVQRALRKAGDVTERGTILSVGLTVRP